MATIPLVDSWEEEPKYSTYTDIKRNVRFIRFCIFWTRKVVSKKKKKKWIKKIKNKKKIKQKFFERLALAHRFNFSP